MIKTSGIEWDEKEKLDVTLERPDVTLYGLIDLLVCHFCFLFSFCFFFSFCLALLLGCVSECLLLYLLEDRVLPVTVCHPTSPAKMYFLNTPSLF